jgi:hypothetical protein
MFLTNFANETGRDCSEEELADVAPGARNTANSLEDLGDHLASHPLSNAHEAKLNELLQSIKTLLSQVQGLVKEVSAAPVSSRAAWKDSNAGTITKVKADLENVAAESSRFYEELAKSSEGRISRALSSLVRDGDEKRLTRLRQSVHFKSQEAWEEIANELEHKGVPKDAATDYQSFVESWVKRAESDGRLPVMPTLVDKIEPMPTQELPNPASRSLVATGIELSQSSNNEAIEKRPTIQTDSSESIGTIKPENSTLVTNVNSEDVTQRDAAENDPALVALPASPVPLASPIYLAQLEADDLQDTPDLTVSPSVESCNYSPVIMLQQNQLENDATHSPEQPVTPKDSPKGKHPIAISTRPHIAGDYGEEDDDSEDDLFGSTPIDQRVPTMDFLPSGVDTVRMSLPPKMEPTVSGPLPSGLFEVGYAPSPVLSSSSALEKETLSMPSSLPSRKRSMTDISQQIIELPPPVPPKEAISLRRIHANKSNLNLHISSRSSAHPTNSSGPPSPLIEPETDLQRNAGEIVIAFSKNKWSEAQHLIQKQINGVENGAFVLLRNEPSQPDVKFLKFLQGVCYSFNGDLLKAKENFDTVLSNVHSHQFKNPTEIAAAKWLGDTCVLLNESTNAALAWSISLGGIITTFGPRDQRARVLAEDLRFLNQFTNALQILKVNGDGMSGWGFSRDVTTIFANAPAPWKKMVNLNTLEYCYKQHEPQNGILRHPKDSRFTIEPRHLMYPGPVATFELFPFDHDPFFSPTSSISLLAALSRPKTNIKIGMISTSSLGRSKSLFFKTDRGAQWLIDTLRQCLDSHAIEYKILQNNFLLRLSQTHSRIAYYQCFSIRLRKLALRNTYGLKMTKALLSTRIFDTIKNPSLQPLLFDSLTEGGNADIPPDPENTRGGLMLRISTYLTECEKPDGQSGKILYELLGNQKFELPDAAIPLELQASTQMPVELDAATKTGKGLWKKKKKQDAASSNANPPQNVVELPA